MIKQLLLFKFKRNVNKEKIDLYFKKYKELESLDCLDSVEFGKNISKEGFDKGFQHGAVATFKSKEDVNVFLEHPDHVVLADKYLNPLLEDFILLEFKS